jgi:ectoine hydroxylase-related dioxygenase (phytanoyl-CoA dioxygenase family)
LVNHKTDPHQETGSGIWLAQHKTLIIVKEIKSIIDHHFSNISESGLELPDNLYFEKVKIVQDELNRHHFVSKITSQIQSRVSDFLEDKKFLIQSNLYFRASRPVINTEESIGWHRESFYGPNMEFSANVWTPIKNVTERNTLQFIPNSHLIKDVDIITQQTISTKTAKGSLRNDIGFLYSPKEIISGVDLTNNQPMVVPAGSSSIFKSALIHGAGNNNGSKIRFSVDFRIISAKHYDKTISKSVHRVSKKAYFLPHTQV